MALGALGLVAPGDTLVSAPPNEASETNHASATRAVSTVDVADFLPKNYVRDGTVSYQDRIQTAIDEAARTSAPLVFPAITYAVTEKGWQLRSGVTLRMHGAVFRLGAECREDGAMFHGRDVTGVTLIGGEVVGRNDVWQDGVNIRGVLITGRSDRIRIHQMHMRDLSSNGIGIFGDADNPIRDVWVQDVIVENCCKRYADYLSGEKGEPGSQREDQGDIACYYVEDFVVRGCRFEGSRSDATHFYRCRRGHITDNRIYKAKMGGYFVETCENVIGRGNVILDNGSRGATIERGSTNCVFADNVVSHSGREGLWAPDCLGLVVTGNVFTRNGRKPNGPERRYIWNANITINEAEGDPTHSPTNNYLVSDNLIETTPSQIAAVRVDATDQTHDIVIQDNLFVGDNRRLLIEGPHRSEVQACHNHGATVTDDPAENAAQTSSGPPL